MNKILKGDRNQCQGCKEYFNSAHAFDKHRLGEFGVDRRCRTPDEMIEIGMAINSSGFWVGSKRELDTIPAQPETPRSDLNGLGVDIPVQPLLEA